MSGVSTSTTPENLGSGVNSPQSYGAEFVFFCFFLFVRHATLLGTESPDGA